MDFFRQREFLWDGGRHVRFERDVPLMNLYLTMLDEMGVQVDSLGDSDGRIKDFGA